MRKILTQCNGNIPLTQGEKDKMIEEASIAYSQFLKALKFDYLGDENSRDTPMRVAKSWVNDLISGCYSEPPKITAFPSDYNGIVFEGGIDVVSMCSHHNLAFTGTCYIGYIPRGRVIGLSKLNRITDWFSRRPQLQESLTQQIHNYLSESLGETHGVCVMVKAKHTCCSHRGIKHKSTMITTSVSGLFSVNDSGCKDEFYKMVDGLREKL